MDDDSATARHYANGALEQAVFFALSASGKDLSALTGDDLAPVDEFHIGGRQATIDLATQAGFAAGSRLLDVGCGLGGASRFFAREMGCRVTGVDVTEDYVRVARELAARTGSGGDVSYQVGSALALPCQSGTFDGAYMLHVGMNVADKQKAFADIRRVLRPGGIFAIYDVMGEAETLAFPVPWASGPATNFVASAATYRRLLSEAGFVVEKERHRVQFALDFFRRMQARLAAPGGPPPLGLHILMGAETPRKVANMIDGLERGLIAPTEMIARAG
jgi:ubiquinone/menaquinone biosynthesis C-methylase UbiE